ncbi:hypothetical protein [Rhizobium ruizarguesonis]|uniref:hypothetical protein n=1 Tax=Rhizobium ruizarguesonis TaxID=2081791 RepID=UPI0010322329|nr:hypothetical protein [Rhizobium ruizarguesonis]TAW11125.1 hypothetical protein ELI26_17000 [Rhizobium ruizarguesonis]
MITKPSNYAVYTPAISQEFAKLGYSQHLKRNFSFLEADLNFLDPKSGLFHYPYALYSAGQAAKTANSALEDNIVKLRDRQRTRVIGDSGGFQIQGNKIKFTGDATCERMLRWMETHTDYSMSLDFPTGGITPGNVAVHAERLIAEGHNLQAMCAANGLSLDFNACLKQSLLNLDYFVRSRKPGATNLLNVLQGRNEAESKAWYEAVKVYGLEGWAFAGAHQNSFSLLLNRLHDMRNDGLLQTAKWIHILGISTPAIAYLFNALQRCVIEVNPDLQITFDTAGPFISAAKFQALMTHRLDKTGWTFSTVSMPKEGNPSDTRTLNELAWEIAQRRPKAKRGNDALQGERALYALPVATTIGSRVRVNEICVGSNGSSDLDNDSIMILMNHNAEAYLRVFKQVNRIFDNPEEYGNDVPVILKGLRFAIENIWADPQSKTTQWASFLDTLASA